MDPEPGRWVQTASVMSSDGAVFDLTIPATGIYRVVTRFVGGADDNAVEAIKVGPNAPALPVAP